MGPARVEGLKIMQEIVRVLRIVEYVGPRELVEKQVARSMHGPHTFCLVGGDLTIRAATIGEYPEILEKAQEAPPDSQ